MIGWLFGLVLPVAAAWAVVRPLLAGGAAGSLLAVGVAAGCGPGLAGIAFVAWRFSLPAGWLGAFPVVDAIVWITILGAALRRSRWRGPSPIDPAPSHLGPLDLLLGAAIAMVGFLSVSYFAFHNIRMPHGEWDAWAVWNLKARFLLRGDENWIDLFSTALPHPGYPLMLPGTVARLWLLVGNATPMASTLVAALFTYATPVVVAGGLACLRDTRSALWGGLITLAATPLTFVGAYQIADVPLAYCIVVSVVIAAVDRTERSAWLLPAAAGLAMALAGLAKDEGLPFLIGMTATYVVCQVVRHHGLARYSRTLMFVSASLPAWTVLIAIRSLAPTTGLSQAFLDPATIDKLWSAERHMQILSTFAHTIGTWAGPGWLGLAPTFAAAAIVGGYRLNGGLWPFVYGVATILTLLVSYYAAFVVTPYDLTWHLTSLNRVLLHVWPTFAWLFCLGASLSPAHSRPGGRRSAPDALSGS